MAYFGAILIAASICSMWWGRWRHNRQIISFYLLAGAGIVEIVLLTMGGELITDCVRGLLPVWARVLVMLLVVFHNTIVFGTGHAYRTVMVREHYETRKGRWMVVFMITVLSILIGHLCW